MSQLTPISGDIGTDSESLLGKNYDDVVGQNQWVCGKNYAVYNIPDGMTAFSANAGLDDEYPDKLAWTFTVYLVEPGGTSRLAFKKKMVYGQHAAISIKLNGSLRLQLGIEWVDPGHLVTCAPYTGYSAIWADAEFRS